MPILRDGELYIMSHSPEQTARLGARLGKLLRPGDVICLSGEMGAGKTIFSQGIGRGWGASDALTSPTYTLVHQYTREDDPTILYHLDCYRLQDAGEVDTLGWDDMLETNGILLIEWPEKIIDALPEERVWIDMRVNEVTRRSLMVEGHGAHYRDLIDHYRTQTFGG